MATTEGAGVSLSYLNRRAPLSTAIFMPGVVLKQTRTGPRPFQRKCELLRRLRQPALGAGDKIQCKSRQYLCYADMTFNIPTMGQ